MSKVNIKQTINAFSDIWAKLSNREKYLAVAGFFITLIIASYYIYEPVAKELSRQQLTLTQLRSDLNNLPLEIEKYIRLNNRRAQIEAAYQGLNIQQGALSHIEELIKNKAEITDDRNFRINPLTEKEFGGGYVQEPFKIELKIGSLTKLVAFLNELINGTRPLVLTRLDIKKSARGDFLNIELDVSNIKQAQSEDI